MWWVDPKYDYFEFIDKHRGHLSKLSSSGWMWFELFLSNMKIFNAWKVRIQTLISPFCCQGFQGCQPLSKILWDLCFTSEQIPGQILCQSGTPKDLLEMWILVRHLQTWTWTLHKFQTLTILNLK